MAPAQNARWLGVSFYCNVVDQLPVIKRLPMNRRCALGLCAIGLVTIPAFPSSSVAQGKSLKDQLVGTWIYVSSTGKREDGSAVPRPSAQGAVTYTADGHFDRGAEVCVGRSSTTVTRGSDGRCVGRGCLHRDLHAGRKHEDRSPQHRDEFGSEFRRSAKSASDRHVDYRRGTEAHEPTHTRRCNAGVGVQAGEVTSLPCYRSVDDDVMPPATGRNDAVHSGTYSQW